MSVGVTKDYKLKVNAYKLFVFFMFFSKLVLFLLKKMAWTKHIFLQT